MSEPKQKPGRSKQDYETPAAFIEAIARRFGRPDFDLAASATNAKAPAFLTESDDALAVDWASIRNVDHEAVLVAFLNPPFANIRPWAKKCESVRDLPRWTLMLVPASMGSLWWRDHVIGKCQADGVTRMQFVGAESLYPKDLALLAYGFGVSGHGFWQWTASGSEAAQ